MLIPFHVVTGCDHPSGFNRYGKKSMFENLQKDHVVQHLLQKVGEYLELSDDGGMIWGGLCFWKYMGKGIYLVRSKSWKMEKNEEEKLRPSSCWWRHFASSFGSSKLFILPPKALRTESSSFSQRTWLGTQKRKMLTCLICSSSNGWCLATTTAGALWRWRWKNGEYGNNRDWKYCDTDPEWYTTFKQLSLI